MYRLCRSLILYFLHPASIGNPSWVWIIGFIYVSWFWSMSKSRGTLQERCYSYHISNVECWFHQGLQKFLFFTHLVYQQCFKKTPQISGAVYFRHDILITSLTLLRWHFLCQCWFKNKFRNDCLFCRWWKPKRCPVFIKCNGCVLSWMRDIVLEMWPLTNPRHVLP